ncbi:MAG: type II toxin-antitoxin system RelE/ParE family toxin [Clostridia bacterium]|nr:type II toxin-antitoxin system RelE/ParE family toxin [Clostridia bacterium]
MKKGEYSVKLMLRAARDIEECYAYIAEHLHAPQSADALLDSLENAIYSLEEFPYRCPTRKTRRFADAEYRQLFVKNFVIVFRIDEENKTVLIVTVRYARSEF